MSRRVFYITDSEFRRFLFASCSSSSEQLWYPRSQLGRCIWRSSDTTNAFKGYHRTLSAHFNLTVELPLKTMIRGYSWTVIPITWRNRRTGVAKLKIQEMGRRYLFICLYLWLEKYLSRGDYERLAFEPKALVSNAGKEVSATAKEVTGHFHSNSILRRYVEQVTLAVNTEGERMKRNTFVAPIRYAASVWWCGTLSCIDDEL